MPYIKKHEKKLLDELSLVSEAVSTPGRLNYCITRLCITYLDTFGEKYLTINEIIGALECAKQEFYRRIAIPYEDIKIKENGDVY